MLYLDREPGEEIVIGDDVVIRINSIREIAGGQYKTQLGITAPRDVTVDRMERHLEKQAADD